MPTVFLTGFPGFLGSALLPRLLRRDPDLVAVCLVLRRFLPLAAQRTDAIVAADPTLAGRIELVEGDITEPDLGLGDRRDALLTRIDDVYHLAAAYDIEVAPDVAQRVNVDGTRHVLELCRAVASLRRLHYMSTCYVSGRWPGTFRETDLRKGQQFNNAYEETKHTAEVLVDQARAAGLPSTVYRPAVVGGDATTGATQKFDGHYLVIRWLLRQPKVAFVPVVGDTTAYRFNAVPRDFVVDGVDALSRRQDTIGGTFALADPAPYTVQALLDLFADAAGKRLVTVPLPPGIVRGALRRVPGLQRLTGIPPGAVDYFVHPTQYATDQADRVLREEGVVRPDRDRWFRATVDYVRANPDVTSAAMV